MDPTPFDGGAEACRGFRYTTKWIENGWPFGGWYVTVSLQLKVREITWYSGSVMY